MSESFCPSDFSFRSSFSLIRSALEITQSVHEQPTDKLFHVFHMFYMNWFCTALFQCNHVFKILLLWLSSTCYDTTDQHIIIKGLPTFKSEM